jgi:hypothetical protein
MLAMSQMAMPTASDPFTMIVDFDKKVDQKRMAVPPAISQMQLPISALHKQMAASRPGARV